MTVCVRKMANDSIVFRNRIVATTSAGTVSGSGDVIVSVFIV